VPLPSGRNPRPSASFAILVDVRKKREWRPSAAERERLTEHLFHEVQMTFFLAAQIGAPTGSRLDVSLRNAQIEAFTSHLRQVSEFFWGDPPSPKERHEREAFAADYFPDGEWARLRPELPTIIAKTVGAPDGSRLTYSNAWVRPADLLWDVVTQAFALAPIVMRFADTVDRAQFTAGYVNGMRVCAEMFVSGQRPPATDDLAA
jgi:hypothetical protein